MDKKEFIEYMQERFELDNISRNLLESIWNYSNEKCLTKEEQSKTIYFLLLDAFGSDIEEEEYKQICGVDDLGLLI